VSDPVPGFRALALISAVLCFALAALWLFVPWLFAWLWGLDYSYAMGLVGRRSGALFLGLGVMFALLGGGRTASPQRPVFAGFMVACFALAGQGVGEWIGGHAGPGILLAVLVELALALAFLGALRSRARA